MVISKLMHNLKKVEPEYPVKRTQASQIPAPKPAIPSKSHKFLGVIINENLNFKEHSIQALAKGTKYTLPCNRMICPMKGIKGCLMKRLYEGVVIPKMLYAADMWCAGLILKGRDKKLDDRGAQGFTSQLARVQQMAKLMITDRMRSSVTNILDVHTNILPFQQMLQKLLESSKDIKKAYEYDTTCNFGKPKHHLSPLHKLAYEFTLNPKMMEKILSTRYYPKWKPDVEVEIAHKKEEVVDDDERATKDLRVYLDGSVIDGGVGAAAVLMQGEEVIDKLRFYLGKENEHMVYEGEIMGMILAVKLMRRAGGGRSMVLGLDNQAAI
ncbi:hypothetical protein F4604DRAFT_1883642 [Suillus subluteus]|nr:hypothetical protein F4604DRAFT_1883642 [Suillus subluteus]